ncbi:MAG TPA: C45 family peptidase [Anaerolineales bacterium]|nr:C45 family peptidase [Anaerolineales bacterium]
MIKQIHLAGDHYAMGVQHGRQVAELQPFLAAAMENRLDALEEVGIDSKRYIAEQLELWEEAARPTLEMLRGMGEALGLPEERYFKYTIASYLSDRARGSSSEGQGCTVWSAAGPVTVGDEPLLAKNRDYWLDHRRLQCLASARPHQGYRYQYLTSAGSPGVFSAGMNEAGLAVADTHVACLDIGQGLPRYALMMEILEHHDSVRSALDYLAVARHVGDGTLALVDAAGEMAVFEAGHSHPGVVLPEGGYVVATNHYVTPHLHGQWIEREPPGLQGNSQARYARVRQDLEAACGRVDLAWAQALMSSHGGRLDSICRHPEIEPGSGTIASLVFRPQVKTFYLADGLPCQGLYHPYPLV